MTFGLSGMSSAPLDSRLNINPQGLMNTTDAAILYVFRPFRNQFKAVELRPSVYNFNDNFKQEAANFTDLAKNGLGQSSSLVQELQTLTNLNDQMTPLARPEMTFHAEQLSLHYRFILILTQGSSDLAFGGTIVPPNTNMQVRRIYNGYFTDEPYSGLALSPGDRKLNPNAFMVITHKTIVGTHVESGYQGSRTRLNTTSSELILQPEVSRSLMGFHDRQDNRFFMTTPETCVNSFVSTEDGGMSFMAASAHGDISKETAAVPLHDMLEMPTQNVTQVMRGMLRHQEEEKSRDRLMFNRIDTQFSDSVLDSHLDRGRLAMSMALPRSRYSDAFDLDVNDRISPDHINSLVNNRLHVIQIGLDRPDYYETADQGESSVTMQYSYMITSIVPSLLNAAGLNVMNFAYEVVRRGGIVHDHFEQQGAESNYPLPDYEVMMMAKSVELELIRGVFRTIFEAMGDFQVVVSANVMGHTSVKLSLIEQGKRATVPFELPSCMGGLISPLIGSASSHVYNSEKVEDLFGVATRRTGNQYPGNFNEDDRNFMDHMNGLDWKQQMTIDPNHPEMDLREHVDYD